MSDKKKQFKSTSITSQSVNHIKRELNYITFIHYILFCFNSFSVQYLKTSLWVFLTNAVFAVMNIKSSSENKA